DGKKEADRAVIIRWMRQFHDEAVPEDPLPDFERLATRHLREGSIFFWDNGKPVSMVVHVRSAQSTASISRVFTPPQARGNGYASACVTALCEHLLSQEFTRCVLYTDLANPTSNRIYRQIGFSPVCDVRHFAFGLGHPFR
ncbi:GNAT family N-acetyltransferase, partial [Candidatus Bipolaricaulota bacterium]|nr:GNAT family N-acetyltransferase [Candidatus Bipolaricaulota bacterium]